MIPRANENAINLIESMLCFNPMKRPTASQCLQHPFFQCHSILTLYGLNISQATSNIRTKTKSSSNIVTLKDEKKENKGKLYSQPQTVKKYTGLGSDFRKTSQINSKYSNNKLTKN